MPTLAQQRHVGGEQLGDAAAVRGGVDVQHPRALQRLGELADALDESGLDDAGVVVEVLVEQRDAFEQRSAPAGGRSGRPFSGQSIADALAHVVCPDKFRGTLSAAEAAARDGGRAAQRAGFDDVVELPLADGGEGTLDTLLAARGGSRRHATRHRSARRSGRRRVGSAARRASR